MGEWKNWLSVALLATLPGQAHSLSLTDTFATCTGRFSAELEHAWLMHQDKTEELTQKRRTFVELLQASAPQDQLREVLSIRVEAKMAHASLLTKATFSDDAATARWARQRALEEIGFCAGLLLDS